MRKRVLGVGLENLALRILSVLKSPPVPKNPVLKNPLDLHNQVLTSQWVVKN